VKIKTLAAAMLVAGASSLTHAEGFNYTYVEATYQIYGELDIYQWEVKGSYQVNDQFYIVFEDGNLPADRSFSGGLIIPLDNGMNVYAQLGLADNVDDMYPILEAGLRMKANEQIEIRGALRIEPEGAGGDGETYIIGEGVYHMNERVALTGGIVLPDEAEGSIVRIGARLNF
jgi:hypothetical protein